MYIVINIVQLCRRKRLCTVINLVQPYKLKSVHIVRASMLQ